MRWNTHTKTGVGGIVGSYFLFLLVVSMLHSWTTENKSITVLDQRRRVGKKENVAKVRTCQRNGKNCLNSSIIILAFGSIRKGYCSLDSQKKKGKSQKWICETKLNLRK